MSDLHLRFNGDPHDFICNLWPCVDLQIVAGDVIDGTRDVEPLVTLCQRFGDTPVVFVPGNHEYFGDSHHGETEQNLLLLENQVPNLHVLIRDTYPLEGGKKIWGTTMWYQAHTMTMVRHRRWADFRNIRDHVKSTQRSFKKDNEFLSGINEGDVVVTHLLPSWKCVNSKFQGSKKNELFVVDKEIMIWDKKPAVWIHGHTHCQVEKDMGSTRVLCNPRGVQRKGKPENPLFDQNKFFEI